MMKNYKKESLSELISSLPDYTKKNEVIKSNIYPIDKLLEGGFELGSFIQFVADSGIGKTTIALGIADALCNKGFKVLYIDAERSVSSEILETTNVKSYLNSNFILVKESEFSVVEDVLDKFISTGEINFVIIDSIAVLINSCFTSIDGKKISITTNNTSYNSVPLTKFMDKYKALAGDRKLCFIFINQYRNELNMVSGSKKRGYGANNSVYNTDIIIKIDKASSYKEKAFHDLTKDAATGIPLVFEISKSNKSKSGITVPAFLNYGVGLASRWNYIYELIEKDIIRKNGSYYSMLYDNEEIKAQGILNFVKELEDKGLMQLDILESLITDDDVLFIDMEEDK